MAPERAEGYADGYMVGWNKCREKMCKKYNIKKSNVIVWENSDERVLQEVLK